MKVEFLIKNPEHLKTIKEITFDSLKPQVNEVLKNQLWNAIFEMHGENMQSANMLSNVFVEIVKKCEGIVVYNNESSAYYTRRLFPLVNAFERKLRQLLYLSSLMVEDDENSKVIKELEGLDFGELFELLFVDEEFNKNIKKIINDKSRKYSKFELENIVKECEETNLWSKLLGSETLVNLQHSFEELRGYRNKIAHARTITAEDYKKIDEKFENINNEIDDKISELYGSNMDSEAEINPEFNNNLANALLQVSSGMDVIRFRYEQVINDLKKGSLSSNSKLLQAQEYANKLKIQYEQMLGEFENNPEIREKLLQVLEPIQIMSEKLNNVQTSMKEGMKSLLQSEAFAKTMDMHIAYENYMHNVFNGLETNQIFSLGDNIDE